MKIKINTKPVDFNKVDGICERKCKTCAYKSELLLEEKEYETKDYVIDNCIHFMWTVR